MNGCGNFIIVSNEQKKTDNESSHANFSIIKFDYIHVYPLYFGESYEIVSIAFFNTK